jgi:serine/threonine protein kinase
MRCVLECLSAVHARGIVHADIKLKNLLIPPDFGSATVIDWGFGTRIADRMNPVVGARMSRSPEMLLGFTNFGAKGDIWAVGCVVLEIILNNRLPWYGSTTAEEIAGLTQLFGSDAMRKYAKDLGISAEFCDGPGRDWNDVLGSAQESLRDPPLFDFVQCLLTLDYRNRPTADEALSHPFFSWPVP